MNSRFASLATEKKVADFNKHQKMIITYNPALVTLIREVRQLSILGYKIPAKILETTQLAQKYMKQAKALDHVRHFSNNFTIYSNRKFGGEEVLTVSKVTQHFE